MEVALKLRSTMRGSFTKVYNALQTHLLERNMEETKATFSMLENKWIQIQEKDEEILKLLVMDVTLTDEDFEKEDEVKLQYETKYEMMKVKINNLETATGNRETIRGFDDDEKSVMSTGNYSNLRLPAIKFDTFDGDLKNWLPFWGQFEIIHKDESIPTFHKFRILSQSLKEGSRAKQVVDSFPISKEIDNYNAAVEALKERFGREDLLIEVYIRELLEMIVQNSKSCQLSLADLYDKLECKLRFLEILGVTTGKSAAIICPLLESCMSEEFLRVWQRSYTSDDVKYAEKRLGKFREFIKAEVQHEQRISLAMTKFGIADNVKEQKFGSKNYEKTFKAGTVQKRKDTPAAMGLLTAQENRQACIFCDLSHNSTDCFKARDMTYEDKLKRVRDSRSCYLCLKGSHSSKQCRIKTSCMICDRKHATILCSSFTRNKNSSGSEISNQVSGEPRKKEEPVNVTTTASVTCDTTVLLPTLKLQLKNSNGKTCVVRAVIDTGSQRSYVLNSTAAKMGFKDNGNEKLCVSLFGGKKSDIAHHKKFLVYLCSLKGDFECLIEALGQDMICGDLPPVPSGPWIDEMVACGIEMSDLLHDSGPVELLLGADVAGTLLTGNVKKLSSGSLVGIETYLGWTVSGRIPLQNRKKLTAATLITTNMFCNNMNVSDLWRLDLIGIDDTSVYKTKDGTEAEINEFFLDTVTTNEDGRYEVCLPWKPNHSPLPANFELASKRLDSTRQKLQKDGFLVEYDTVFKEWEAEGVIKEIPVTNEGHFLPHHHVVKLNSTTQVRPVFDASAHQKGTCSLNQCLERGSNLIEQIPSLLTSFRMKELGVIADIRRAFLQISVNPKDRKYLKFLWRKPNGDLISFQHNRVVTSLTTEDFLVALRRFVARRGRPNTVYSDQGTNFKGTDNLFRKLDWNKVLEYCDVNRISWKFNPPSAPWWGGWWERLVGLTKQLLRRILRRSTMTYIEMETVLCDCESVLNSRPLTYVAEGSSEPIFITPSMFIQDIKEAGLPELDTLESSSFDKKWQHRKKLKEEFRNRFRNEYLGLLKQRVKLTKQKKINIGDIVLIGSDNSKRMNWPLARVIETIPGKDGVTRLVRLNTTNGECLRPVQRVYHLLEGQDIQFDKEISSNKKTKK